MSVRSAHQKNKCARHKPAKMSRDAWYKLELLQMASRPDDGTLTTNPKQAVTPHPKDATYNPFSLQTLFAQTTSKIGEDKLAIIENAVRSSNDEKDLFARLKAAFQ